MTTTTTEAKRIRAELVENADDDQQLGAIAMHEVRENPRAAAAQYVRRELGLDPHKLAEAEAMEDQHIIVASASDIFGHEDLEAVHPVIGR